MGFFTSLLAAIGSFTANFGTNACYYCFFDEPECPKSLIK